MNTFTCDFCGLEHDVSVMVMVNENTVVCEGCFLETNPDGEEILGGTK